MAQPPGPTSERIPRISWSLLHFFRWLVRRNFRRDFHAVRVSGLDHLGDHLDAVPLIVYANHSGWWDPMTAFLLAQKLFRKRRHFAPMEADALRRYPILARIGVFPVQLSSPRGAVSFLRTGSAVLRSGGVLWVTPQGRFADVRERPLVFKAGMAALATRVADCAILPLAIEYVFWDERTPEALLHFGKPLHPQPGEPASALESRLVVALESVMAELQALAVQRNGNAFERTLIRGRAGVGGFYGFGQRARAWLRRQPYQPEHTPAGHPATTEPARAERAPQGHA